MCNAGNGALEKAGLTTDDVIKMLLKTVPKY
jgi:antitoxin component of RelBE/YafQ-DinJ toxin-antitoxin module